MQFPIITRKEKPYVIFCYPKNIPGRACVVAEFNSKEAADSAFSQMDRKDMSYIFEGKQFKVTDEDIVRRYDYSSTVYFGPGRMDRE
jgi:hypothetical protein